MIRTLFALLLTTWLAACTINNVATDYDPAAMLVGAGSYAWAPPQQGNDPFASLDQQRIRTAVDQALAMKPMQPVAPAEAELWVQSGIELREVRDLNTMEMGAGFGNPFFIGGETVVHVNQYTQAIIYVQFINPKTTHVVWRGQVTRPWSEHTEPAKRERVLREALNQIIARFPPLPGK
jgi:hypothetical protein